MNMPHIVQFSPRFLPLLGGPEIDISTIVSQLKGYRFSVISNALSGLPRYEQPSPNTAVWRVGPVDPFLSSRITGQSWKWKVLKAGIWDLLRHMGKLKLISRIKPDLVHVRDIDGWHFLKIDNMLRQRVFEGLAKYVAWFRDLEIPLLLTKHYLYPQGKVPPNYGDLEDFLVHQFDFVQCVDRHIFDEMNARLSGRGVRVWLSPVYVDTHTFTPRPMDDHAGVVVGYIGRHDTDKGTDLLARLVKVAPPWLSFVAAISGTTQEIAEFRGTVEGGRITIYENVPHDDLPTIIQNFDILMNPVETEGISRVALEAMACGRPVIMTKLGNRHPVIDRETGFLCAPHTEVLLEILGSLVNSRRTLEELGLRARQIVEKEYDADHAMEHQKAIYESVLLGSASS
jgi:glycosyltransferase involved in cell wall biosynthesis